MAAADPAAAAVPAPEPVASPSPNPLYFTNNQKISRRTPRKQLILALQDLVSKFPPSFHDPEDKKGELEFSNGGLYYGEISIAFLLMALNEFYADVELYSEEEKADLPFSIWLIGYLNVISEKTGREVYPPPTPDDCGVKNSRLASLALKAAMTKDTESAVSLCTDFTHVVLAPNATNDWLNGRAGYLYLLRLVSTSFRKLRDVEGNPLPETEEQEDARLTLDETINLVIKAIMDSPRPWKSSGKHRLGAAHGDAGIITQIILSEPRILYDPNIFADADLEAANVDATDALPPQKRKDYGAMLKAELGVLLSYQDEDGNWPSSIPSGKTDLVQFCHGAPGIISALLSIRKFFTSASPESEDQDMKDRIDDAIDLARKLIWEKGLLTKEPCLCHGISGNALALDHEGFEHFLTYTTRGEMAEMAEDPRYERTERRRYESSLYCGAAGRVWAWAISDHSDFLRRFLGFNDI